METQNISSDIAAALAARIKGLRLRNFRGEADYPGMLSVLLGDAAADQTYAAHTLEDIRNNYAHLHHCDPYQDMVFVEVDGEMVGYGRVWWDINQEQMWIGYQLGFLLPAWRRKSIGAAILAFNENRLREIVGELSREGNRSADLPRFTEVWCEDRQVGKETLLQRSGYQAVRYGFHMVRRPLDDIPDLPLPAGLEVRQPRPEHYRAVWDASQEAFQDAWGFVQASEEDYQNWLGSRLFDPPLWRVAWDGDQVAGSILSFIDEEENALRQRKRGYTEMITVRRPWRRRGLARSLLAQSLQAVRERGMEEAALAVDTQNPSGALHLYESLGFQTERRAIIYRKEIA